MNNFKKRDSNFSTTKKQRESVFSRVKSSKLRQGQRGSTLIYKIVTSIIFIIFVVVVVAIYIPNFLRARSAGRFTQCQANCKKIGTALEMYANDNDSSFPARLSQLIPKYLMSIPMCADAGRDTYSQSYQSSANPDSFTFYCTGHNHKWVGVSPNYPQYNSHDGLIPR